MKQSRKKDKVREASVKCYLSVESENLFIQDALSRINKSYHLKEYDKRRLKELVTGAVKMKGALNFILEHFSKHKLSRWTKACLILGLYQLVYNERIPDYAAVNEFVQLAARYDNPGAASLVNAVLRRYLRESDSIEYPDVNRDPSGHIQYCYSLPQWIADYWIEAFGIEDAIKLAEWANSHQYPSLRFNSLEKRSPDDNKLTNQGFLRNPHFPDYYQYKGGGDPRDTDIFLNYPVYFQDPSAGFAAKLAGLEPEIIVFDIGAAPGGKTINCYEQMEGKGTLFAIEINHGKLKGLKKNLYRMGINTVNIIGVDVKRFYPKKLADIALVDVPCSGMGTLARNADMRWRLNPEDICKLQSRQEEILESASALVNEGGKLIYSACTFTKEETQNVINRFLHNHQEFKRIKLHNGKYNLKPESFTPNGDLMILPYHYDTDGAYVSLLQRR
ncbi:MAG: 16S rRNA (cytosine(967)-C(5))-methyltransferase RsmB [candidate division Zixibacteria bacterium]|nr:16S rRNA (cytosine(967)-C(5))-methyltransferase RsmB [candidate division Zixibacteria bacterium]